MRITVENVEIKGVVSALPCNEVDNADVLGRLCPEKAAAVMKTTGITKRRVAPEGTTPADLCICAAREAMRLCSVGRGDIKGIVFVSFTSPSRMPCAAAQVQSALDLGSDVFAYDVSMACSGYVYGLHAASVLACQTLGTVLLLDGDVQTPFMDPSDPGTQAVLADGGSATVVSYSKGAPAWDFGFLTCGSKGSALTLGPDRFIKMDGFGVFRFVSEEVAAFGRDFFGGLRAQGRGFSAFVPHQPNAYMVRSLASALGFSEKETWLSVDRVGNVSSASIPVTIAMNAPSELAPCGGDLALCAFGGGLSAAAASVRVADGCIFAEVGYGK